MYFHLQDHTNTNTTSAPLVFFISPNDPRFLSTIDRILMPPEKGGLTSTGLVFRYDTEMAEDGKFPAYSKKHLSYRILTDFQQVLEVERVLSRCAHSGLLKL